jgi:hypothetical protein
MPTGEANRLSHARPLPDPCVGRVHAASTGAALATGSSRSEIVKTLDRITGHRDSNQEAVRRGFIACPLFPTRSSPPPSGNVMDEIEPNPRGITRSEVEQAVAEWCQTHTDAPLCKKLERP